MQAHALQVVYHWAKGMPFKDTSYELTDVLKGSIAKPAQICIS